MVWSNTQGVVYAATWQSTTCSPARQSSNHSIALSSAPHLCRRWRCACLPTTTVYLGEEDPEDIVVSSNSQKISVSSIVCAELRRCC
jgi:hypothetical protein